MERVIEQFTRGGVAWVAFSNRSVSSIVSIRSRSNPGSMLATTRLQVSDEHHVVHVPTGEFDRPFFVNLEAVLIVERSTHVVVGHNG